jgi:hypothetical protein
VQNKDSYEARLRWIAELFVRDVHTMGVIRNLRESPYQIRS